VSALAAADLRYAARGWRVVLCRPEGKEAVTTHGVNDATTDPQTLARWRRRWPRANTAIATGFPGPTVLDVDYLELLRRLLAEPLPDTPVVASPGTPGIRRHFYFAGLSRSTFEIKLGDQHVGELRGRGSYIMAPPSVHPNGREYVWLGEPRGPLPQVPAALLRLGHHPGRGVMPIVERVPPGCMYEHLKGLSIWCARAGIVNPRVIHNVLVSEFEEVRVPGADYGDPRAGRRDTRRLAEWAAASEIAKNEFRRRRRA
jgi:hypothetical protein